MILLAFLIFQRDLEANLDLHHLVSALFIQNRGLVVRKIIVLKAILKMFSRVPSVVDVRELQAPQLNTSTVDLLLCTCLLARVHIHLPAGGKLARLLLAHVPSQANKMSEIRLGLAKQWKSQKVTSTSLCRPLNWLGVDRFQANREQEDFVYISFPQYSNTFSEWTLFVFI